MKKVVKWENQEIGKSRTLENQEMEKSRKSGENSKLEIVGNQKQQEIKKKNRKSKKQ